MEHACSNPGRTNSYTISFLPLIIWLWLWGVMQNSSAYFQVIHPVLNGNPLCITIIWSQNQMVISMLFSYDSHWFTKIEMHNIKMRSFLFTVPYFIPTAYSSNLSFMKSLASPSSLLHLCFSSFIEQLFLSLSPQLLMTSVSH